MRLRPGPAAATKWRNYGGATGKGIQRETPENFPTIFPQRVPGGSGSGLASTSIVQLTNGSMSTSRVGRGTTFRSNAHRGLNMTEKPQPWYLTVSLSRLPYSGGGFLCCADVRACGWMQHRKSPTIPGLRLRTGEAFNRNHGCGHKPVFGTRSPERCRTATFSRHMITARTARRRPRASTSPPIGRRGDEAEKDGGRLR